MKALLLAALLLPPPAALAGQAAVKFKTSDGCSIAAFYLAPSSGAYVFINAHGLGSSKGEWGAFQTELAKAGQGYLSLDLRGHADSASCGGKPADYRKFDKAAWAAASRDIEAAAAWLAKKGIGPGRQVFCGASVGANLSLKAAAEGRLKPAALVLLSPGMDYAGIEAGKYLPAFKGPLLLAASPDDPYAWASARELARRAAAAGQDVSFANGGGGHGVQMLAHPGLAAAIISKVLERNAAQKKKD